MKKFLLILLAILANGQWLMVNGQTVDLTKYTHITSLSQIEEGAYYYIVSDRRKFNYQTGGDGGTDGDKVQIKAMSTYQNGFTAVNWDNPGNNVYFVYYGDLDPKCNGFIWKAEKAGDLTEDDLKDYQEDIQKIHDKAIKDIDQIIADKDKEVM